MTRISIFLGLPDSEVWQVECDVVWEGGAQREVGVGDVGGAGSQALHRRHLPDHRGEGVGDDGEHDQDGEQEDEQGGQDQPHVLRTHKTIENQYFCTARNPLPGK